MATVWQPPLLPILKVIITYSPSKAFFLCKKIFKIFFFRHIICDDNETTARENAS
uniref:Uncharacterized protein n=1 Tax=Siphoviridae sp. ctf8W5 TaxID=2825595 RepID=A0A8S5Q835_9CAUD|nr:MAG TPA: hypothetical protein [Siphoviridae sp. ctf8W5]